MRTLDDYGTFHGMGVISASSPLTENTAVPVRMMWRLKQAWSEYMVVNWVTCCTWCGTKCKCKLAATSTSIPMPQKLPLTQHAAFYQSTSSKFTCRLYCGRIWQVLLLIHHHMVGTLSMNVTHWFSLTNHQLQMSCWMSSDADARQTASLHGAPKKVIPAIFCKFLSNCLEFFNEILQLCSLFIWTYNCQISFNYLGIWQSYVILNATTQRFWRG